MNVRVDAVDDQLESLRCLIKAYGLDANALIQPYGAGRVNQTYLVETMTQRYLLQRISAQAFPKPWQVPVNHAHLQILLAHHPEVCIPRQLTTLDGESFVRDSAGVVWRMQEFIRDSQTLPELNNDNQAFEVGRILGVFHHACADIPLSRLTPTLPGFHATQKYCADFDLYLQQHEVPDVVGLDDDIAFVASQRKLLVELEQLNEVGDLHRQITHGDPKLDNILFDLTGQRAIAMVDLDTVQPGLLVFDLGDCLRSCCNLGRTGEQAITRFSGFLARHILQGYFTAWPNAREYLSPSAMLLGIQLLPFELGLRFLYDYLQGNPYFHVSYADENLVRARKQFALLRDIQAQRKTLCQMLEEFFNS